MSKNIILCATQRCGSTMICDAMRNSLVLGVPEEYYIPWVSADIKKYDWKKEQKGVVQKGIGANGIFSIKIMSNQVESVAHKLKTIPEFSDLDIYSTLPSAYNLKDTLWVRIIRLNTLKQAISRVMARQTGVCHSVEKNSQDFFAGKTCDYNDSYNEKTVYNYNAIVKEVFSIKKEELFWNAFFKINKIKPFKIIYEEASKDIEKVISDMARNIDINVRESEIKTQMKKLSNKKNNDWYEATLKNYIELNKINIHNSKPLEGYCKELFVHGGLWK